MSRNLALALAVLTTLAPICMAQESATPGQEVAGWTDFLAIAGPELTGFTRVPIPPDGTLSEKSPWSYDAETGILECRGDLAGHEWLRWDQKLDDGALRVEWRFVPVDDGKRYNSGVFIRNSADGRVWHQAQTGDSSGGFLFGETPVNGELKRLKQAGGGVKPAGQWNVFEIVSEGPKLTLSVNGQPSSDWDNLETLDGYAGLEAEGWRIEFRKLLFKPLHPKP